MPTPSTRLSLFQQVQNREEDAWRQLDSIYRPLIGKWLRRSKFVEHEIDDVIQEVMTVLLRRIADFQHNGRTGAFRSYLRKTAVLLAKNARRRVRRVNVDAQEAITDALAMFEDPSSASAMQFDNEHDVALANHLMRQIECDFHETKLQAFRRYAIDRQPASEVANHLGLSIASVHTAKSRVLKRLREVGATLLH
ncbi:MAG: sigma-70 family RNA polymerase sigma factor, partial [Planctomycetota bacterium]